MLESILGFFIKAIVLAVTIIAPIHAAMLAVGFLAFADLVLGILAARKRGEKITSAGLRRTVVKLVLFQVGIVTAFVVETYLTQGLFPIVKTLTALIGTTELVSVLENINTVLNTNLLDKLIKLLRSKNDKE